MTVRVFVASSEGSSGKSTIALGLLDALIQRYPKVRVYRPVVRDSPGRDYVLDLLMTRLPEPMDPDLARGVTYSEVHHDPRGSMEKIVAGFARAAEGADAVLVVGSDFSDVPTPTEFAFNAELAANLGAPMVLVLTGHGRSPEDVATAADVALVEIRAHHARVVGIIANGVTADPGAVRDALRAASTLPSFVIPDTPLLRAPRVRDLMAAADGTQLYGNPELLDVESEGIVVAAMTMPHVLDRLIPGGTVITPGDREDVLLGVLLAHRASTFPSMAAVILNGGFELGPQVSRLIDGLNPELPVISSDSGTMDTAQKLSAVRGRLTADSPRKLQAAEQVFAANVEAATILDAAAEVISNADGAITPLMFEQQLLQHAATFDAHVVLPEGSDDRILQAAGKLLRRRVSRLTILGDPEAISARATELQLDLSGAELLSPNDPEMVEAFAAEYARLREHKGMTIDKAREVVTDVSYFGTMMVLTGRADGMVSGADHTTAHTIRPALEVIRTVPDVSVVSSVFFMCLADRVLVYGDCAVNPDPDARQLADIATSSARTARQFGVDPRVAMLSYSTGSSGGGDDVEKVRAATDLVREQEPELPVEGPIQYDAAVDPEVAKSKLADSQVAGRATVLIFPDLNTGNNTYKAVQRSAGAVAIGPVLQGLRKPVNDLSRGATVRDIVNTVAITAIQAGSAR